MRTSSNDCVMTSPSYRAIPDYVSQEARKLREIWDATPGRPPQAQFGEMFEIGGQSAVGNFLAGRSALSLKAAVGFARGLGVPISSFSPRLAAEARDLSAGLDVHRLPSAPSPIDMHDHPDLSPVRVVRLKLKAGSSGFAIDSDESEAAPIFFRNDWLMRRGLKPYHLVAIKVSGQSMEPTLYQGDVVVANTADREPKDGEVFAVNYEGEPVVKRMLRESGLWWLSSDNPDARRFPRKQCANEECIVIGRIVHRQSEHI